MIFVIVLSVVGAAISAYILSHKLENKTLACFIGEDCDRVVKSRYGKLFGFPNEILGIAYYVVAIGLAAAHITFDQPYIAVPFGDSIIGASLAAVFRIISGAALFMSAALAGIQYFILKEWCELCLITAGINLVVWGIVFF